MIIDIQKYIFKILQSYDIAKQVVFEIVKEIGIDYSQGYFFSETTEFPNFEK